MEGRDIIAASTPCNLRAYRAFRRECMNARARVWGKVYGMVIAGGDDVPLSVVKGHIDRIEFNFKMARRPMIIPTIQGYICDQPLIALN